MKVRKVVKVTDEGIPIEYRSDYAVQVGPQVIMYQESTGYSWTTNESSVTLGDVLFDSADMRPPADTIGKIVEVKDRPTGLPAVFGQKVKSMQVTFA